MDGGNTHYQLPSSAKDERRHLKVGDVVQSERFVVAVYDADRTRISLGTKPKGPKIMIIVRDEEERVRLAAETGEIPAKEYPFDFSADDETRAIATFVVERSELEGGSSRHISIRRLNDDGSYNKNGEVIHFCEYGNLDCIDEPGSIRIIGNMRLTFV